MAGGISSGRDVGQPLMETILRHRALESSSPSMAHRRLWWFEVPWSMDPVIPKPGVVAEGVDRGRRDL